MRGLILHSGSNVATREQVAASATPAGTQTWTPIPHGDLCDLVEKTLLDQGFEVEESQFGLWPSNGNPAARMFGVYALKSRYTDFQLLAGLRNAHDQSIRAMVGCGSRVFVCDNTSFSAEIVIGRKHTSGIWRDLPRLVTEAVGRLGQSAELQAQRFDLYKTVELSDQVLHDLVIRAVDSQVLPISHAMRVVGEWRKPRHPEFEPRTAWSAFNAFTEVAKAAPVLDLPRRTIRLQGLVDLLCGFNGAQPLEAGEDSEIIQDTNS